MNIPIQNLNAITVPVVCLDLYAKNHPQHPLVNKITKIKEQSKDNRYPIIKLKELLQISENEIKSIYNEIGSDEQYRNLYWQNMHTND